VLTGDSADFDLTAKGVKRSPADLDRPGFLNWISKELKAILKKFDIQVAAFKRFEPSAFKNKSTLNRAEVEGVARAVLYENNCRDIETLIKSQIKAITKYSGSAKDVVEVLSTTKLNSELGDDTEEAALVAFARLLM
jgi:Holliday junction resolvasome RuvABC endonuclease subunit